MITITNRKEKIILNDNELKQYKGDFYFFNCSGDTDWEIGLTFKFENDNISKIVKSLGSAEGYSGDLLSEYPNQVKSSEKVVLSLNDFEKIKRLLTKLRTGDIYKRKAVVNAYAHLLAYECYIDLIVYELDKINVDYIFIDIYNRGYFWNEREKFKNDIYEATKEILKKEYKVDLDYLFDGGNDE